MVASACLLQWLISGVSGNILLLHTLAITNLTLQYLATPAREVYNGLSPAILSA